MARCTRNSSPSAATRPIAESVATRQSPWLPPSMPPSRWSGEKRECRVGATIDRIQPPRAAAPGRCIGVTNDLGKMARAVLLAFADLGIYLSSDRERLLRKARALDV